jgi:hypothetical protein
MSIRIKRHWFEDGRQRSPEEKASVVAVAAWKSATHGLQGLRKAKFAVDVGVPFIRVLAEFLVFLVTVADRLAYLHGPTAEDGPEGAGWREAFLNALARRVADLYRENLDQLIGPDETRAGGHGVNFIDLLNRRMAEFAEFDYTDDGPDFGLMRYFGTCIEEALPDPADRRWVLDQIMATQAPEAVETVESAMRGVLGLDPKPARRREGTSGE